MDILRWIPLIIYIYIYIYIEHEYHFLIIYAIAFIPLTLLSSNDWFTVKEFISRSREWRAINYILATSRLSLFSWETYYLIYDGWTIHQFTTRYYFLNTYNTPLPYSLDNCCLYKKNSQAVSALHLIQALCNKLHIHYLVIKMCLSTWWIFHSQNSKKIFWGLNTFISKSCYIIHTL